MSNRNTAATLEYHEVTKHSERSLRSSRHFLDFENRPLAEVTEFFSPHAAGKSVVFLVALGYPDRAARGLKT